MFPFQVLTRVLYILSGNHKAVNFFLISDIHYRDKPLHLLHFQFFRLIYSEKEQIAIKKKRKKRTVTTKESILTNNNKSPKSQNLLLCGEQFQLVSF